MPKVLALFLTIAILVAGCVQKPTPQPAPARHTCTIVQDTPLLDFPSGRRIAGQGSANFKRTSIGALNT